MFFTAIMSMVNLDNSYIPVYTVLYHLPIIMTIGLTNTTIVYSIFNICCTFGDIFVFSTTIISVDNLDHHYIPIYIMFYHLSNVMIIEPTLTITVVSTVSDRLTVISPPTDRPSSGKLNILLLCSISYISSIK